MPEHLRTLEARSGRRLRLFHPGLARPFLFGLVATTGLMTAPGVRAQILDPIPGPATPALLQPAERVPRAEFGVVGAFPLTESDLNSLVFPSTTEDERQAALEGLTFFTTPQTAAEGAGPIANQVFCLGCHMNSAEVVKERGRNQLVTTSSQASRGARATPTNFAFVGFDPTTGGGRPADNLDALENTGKAAAFTVFNDFNPSTGAFDFLTSFSNNSTQHTRPTLPGCLPDPLPPFSADTNLSAGVDPVTHLSQTGFRRATGERSGPPYIGRGLIEAVPDAQITADAAAEANPIQTSLDVSSLFPECSTGECIAGRANMNTSTKAFVGGDSALRVGHFGLRSGGATILQFVVGGVEGEVGFTSPFNTTEPTSYINSSTSLNPNAASCVSPAGVSTPQLPASTPISLRALIRLTAPPEFGSALLAVLNSPDPKAPGHLRTNEEKVRRGAELFGVDLQAFADRMIPGRMPNGGDGLDDHAINQSDRKLNCAGCHFPVTVTGELPADVASTHVNDRWAPLFSDLLLHQGPSIDAERISPTPRLPVLVWRESGEEGKVPSFDLPRSLSDDGLPALSSGLANGREFRTAPLMGLGRIGPPFLHDGRVYLSSLSVRRTPASTVYSARNVTNGPLVVQSVDDALRAAIELHDLPAPGKGCPVPSGGSIGDVDYTDGAGDICPSYGSPTSTANRGDARSVIARYRSLSVEDQLAVVEFLKQL